MSDDEEEKMSEAAEERKRNRDIRDSAVSVLESIPQIPIHVTEIKRLIMKEVRQSQLNETPSPEKVPLGQHVLATYSYLGKG